MQKDNHTFCLAMLNVVKKIYSLTLPSMVLCKIFSIMLYWTNVAIMKYFST